MQDQYFYGHGKLLLTGEYFVIDGAQSLALPTTVGQSMRVKYRNSYQPVLNWRALEHTGKAWFESNFEFWHFKPIRPTGSETEKFLAQVLAAVRLQNPHFLRDDMDVFVETKVEFPLEWGLGSSSSFIYNVAQWAYVSPFELLKRTIGGSGYDIACAQAMGPINYKRVDGKPEWEASPFDPKFKDQIYFLYLGKKQKSQEEVRKYSEMKIDNKAMVIDEVSTLTFEMIKSPELTHFDSIIRAHEDIVSKTLGFSKVKDLYFQDYWGEIKSLGAWGGDFAMVTSSREFSETYQYFVGKGYDTLIPYSEIILNGSF